MTDPATKAVSLPDRLRHYANAIEDDLVAGMLVVVGGNADCAAPEMRKAAILIERLTAEKQEQALQYLSDNGQWIEETARLREANAELLDQMHHFANADQRLWDESQRDPESYKSWVRSRAAHLLEKFK